MTPLAQRASDWLATRRVEMEDMLQRIVDIDSGSRDGAGIDAVGDIMAAMLEADGIAVTRFPNDTYGAVLKADIPGNKGGAPVLLMGHRDTVYPKGTVAARPFTRDGDTARGPGVADMKGGLVVDVFVLRALKAAGGARKPLAVGDGLFTDVAGANRAGLDILFIADGVHGEEVEPYGAEHLNKLFAKSGVQAMAAARKLVW